MAQAKLRPCFCHCNAMPHPPPATPPPPASPSLSIPTKIAHISESIQIEETLKAYRDFSDLRGSDEADGLLWVYSTLTKKFEKHGFFKAMPTMWSLAALVRMDDGMDEGAKPKKQELIDGLVLTEHDRAKLDKRKRKDESEQGQREFNNESK